MTYRVEEGIQRRVRREPVDVIEPKPPEVLFKRVSAIRKQRLERLERACAEQRRQMDKARAVFNERAEELRRREIAAVNYGLELRAAFRGLIITSAEFLRGRRRHSEMQEQANLARADVMQAVARWKQEARALRSLRQSLREVRRSVEKLDHIAQAHGETS